MTGLQPEQKALISGLRLDGKGGCQDIGWKEIDAWTPGSGLIWLHFNYTVKDTHRWLEKQSGLDPLVLEAITAPETRPRCFSHAEGLLVILRGVNLNPGADPEDMVSIRVWIEPGRILTVRHRHLCAVDDIRNALNNREGPESPGDFLVQLCRRLTERMESALAEINDAVDGLEEAVLKKESYQLRGEVSALRRQMVQLRRYLAPQREVLIHLQSERADWLNTTDRIRLREIADQVTRYIEDLDLSRDRASVVRDELENRLSEQMNKNMYLLAIVAAIFLPLGLLTGLLGINVAGIPGAESSMAFLAVCFLLLLIAVLQVILFKTMKLL